MSELENKTELRLANGLLIPREAVTWVFAYLAKRGAGKTYNAAVQAEEMVKLGIPIGVIDGMGIWWGLRSGAVDDKGVVVGKGLPVVVFGGEHADLPLVPEKAAEMAKAIVESNISFVLDLSGFSKTLMRKVVMAFLDELYTINRVERHVFIEESDMFAPQKPFGPEAIMCLSAVDNFIRRGGNHNLGCTLITQRTAVLNKDVLTQADCLVILRTLAPQDKEAIQAWVREQTEEDKEKLKVFYDSLKDLENGECWVWHPEKPSIYQRVKFRQRETFHATREFILNPQASQIKLMNVSDFVSKFKSIFEQGQVSPIDASVKPSVDTSVYTTEIKQLKAELEEFRSGHKLAESVQERLKFLGECKFSLENKLKESEEYGKKITGMEATRCDQLEDAHKKLKAFENLRVALAEIMPAPVLDEATLAKFVMPGADKIIEELKKVVLQEMAKSLPISNIPEGNGATAVAVTEYIPEIQHRIERPVVQTDEKTRDGQLITMALRGFFDQERRVPEIAKELDRWYIFSISKNVWRDLSPYLEKLVKLKVLQRKEAGSGWVYLLADGAKDRIKEAT